MFLNRRGARQIEDVAFQITNLRKELERFNIKEEDGNLNDGFEKLDKDGIKALQKELKDAKYQVSSTTIILKYQLKRVEGN